MFIHAPCGNRIHSHSPFLCLLGFHSPPLPHSDEIELCEEVMVRYVVFFGNVIVYVKDLNAPCSQ